MEGIESHLIGAFVGGTLGMGTGVVASMWLEGFFDLEKKRVGKYLIGPATLVGAIVGAV